MWSNFHRNLFNRYLFNVNVLQLLAGTNPEFSLYTEGQRKI